MARGHHSEHDEHRKVTREHHAARLEDLDNIGFASNIYGESMHMDPRMDEGRADRNDEYSPYSPSHDEFEPMEERYGDHGYNDAMYGRGLM
jgi:hypothetical protein